MDNLTCKDCKHYVPNCVCEYEHFVPFPDMDICSHFETEDGSRPRFCRLASSVDEMADAMVNICGTTIHTPSGKKREYWFEGMKYVTQRTVKHAIRAWLMEVEE